MDSVENPRDAPGHDGYRDKSKRGHRSVPATRKSVGKTTGITYISLVQDNLYKNA